MRGPVSFLHPCRLAKFLAGSGLVARCLIALTLLGVATGAATAAPARKPAGTAAAAKADADALFPTVFRETIERGIADGAFAGVAVGVIDGKRSQALYFGHRDGAGAPAPDASSRFEIGALSEVFTGVLLAQAALDGTARLRDPVKHFLAPDFPFADPRVADATLDALALQVAGLPARPANLFPADLDDPFAGYATEDLLAFLARQRHAAAADASTPRYTLLGVGLLGNLLGRAYATPFDETLRTRVLLPLGMRQAGFDDDALLDGHARGLVAAHWHYGVLGAAAGLRASLPDLLAFLQWNLDPGATPLRQALLLARQPRLGDGADQLALGWRVREVPSGESTWPLLWRASQTAGFSAFIGFRTDQQRAIVLLGNAAEDLAGLGIAWLRGDPPPAAPHGYARARSVDAAQYPGLYRLVDGTDVVVRVQGSRLTVQWPGLWPASLHAFDNDVFASDDAPIALTFMRNVDEIEGVVVRTGDAHVSGHRLSQRAPHLARAAYTAGAAKLDECVGDYRLGEDLWLRIARAGDALVAQPSLGPRITLHAVAADRFADDEGAVEVQVRRDAQGRLDRLVLDLAGVSHDAVPVLSAATAKVAP